MTRRVVVTGFGIISSVGNNCEEVLKSLVTNTSGIEYVPRWKELGLKSQVSGTIKHIDIPEACESIGLKSRFMDVTSVYAVLASEEAIKKSKLDKNSLGSESTACFVSNGVCDTDPIKRASFRIYGNNSREGKGTPYDITRCMGSSCSANLTNYYNIKGRSFSITSACASSLHNVGYGYELLSNSKYNMVLSGGAEDASASLAMMFDNMRIAISKGFNYHPTKASRPYDKHRDGFVLSGGSGIVILEELEHAKARDAPIYAEIIGFGATSDGYDIIHPHPDGDGAYRCMIQALKASGCSAQEIDYINTHATSTYAGDIAEAMAIKKLFQDQLVPISSTKSLTGHGVGAAGVQELIYCILMLQNEFICASSNIDEMDQAFKTLNILTKNRNAKINTIMTNSFGFGGTNASLIIKQYYP